MRSRDRAMIRYRNECTLFHKKDLILSLPPLPSPAKKGKEDWQVGLFSCVSLSDVIGSAFHSLLSDYSQNYIFKLPFIEW